MSEVVRIKTERLKLRLPSTHDDVFFFELMNSKGWLDHIGDRGIKSNADAINYIQNLQKDHESNGFGLFVIILNERPIGICGLLKRTYLDAPDLGFALLPAYIGKGYIKETGTAVINEAFTNLGLNKILAITSPKNSPSQSTLLSLGFKEIKKMTSPEQGEILLYEKQKE